VYFDLSLEDAPPSDGMDIEFGGDDIEIDPGPERHGGGVGGERFNVLRPPTREPFRPQIASGPQGGPMREVGRAGRFPILAEQDRTPPAPRESTLIPREERPNIRELLAYNQRVTDLHDRLMTPRESTIIPRDARPWEAGTMDLSSTASTSPVRMLPSNSTSRGWSESLPSARPSTRPCRPHGTGLPGTTILTTTT
jgi:hypothetical protein